VSNGPVGAPWPKVRRLEAAMQTAMEEASKKAAAAAVDEEQLFALMRDARGCEGELPSCLFATGMGEELERALSSVFIEPASFGGQAYGTRCTTVLRVGPAGAVHMRERTFCPEASTGDELEEGSWRLSTSESMLMSGGVQCASETGAS